MSQTNTAMPLVGVSSWAVHRELGDFPLYGPEAGETSPDFVPDTAELSLLELPAELARQGFDALQICHFHVRTRAGSYLDELANAIRSANFELHALLVDAGDMTHPEHGERDAAWIRDWLPIAAQLGAQHVRVIAGKTGGEGAIDVSAKWLLSLAAQAQEHGLTLLIENWFDLLATPAAVRELLERCEGKVKFQLDFSNWGGPAKYEHLAAIAPLATACHAQASFLDANHIDAADYNRCLRLPYPEQFNGPFVLVNGGLNGIGLLRDFIRNERLMS